jgi:hypothetical protein
LREDHLEDVAGADVLLGGPDRSLVLRGGHGPCRLGLGQPGAWRGHHGRRGRAVGRTGAVGGELDQPGAGLFVGRGRRSGRPVGVCPGHGAVERARHHDVLDQEDALAPVVERADLPDDDQRRVGVAEVVGRHVRQAFDLAHHVVAEIPDQPAVERRQPVERG